MRHLELIEYKDRRQIIKATNELIFVWENLLFAISEK